MSRKQDAFAFRTWGGSRRGAGRPRQGAKKSVAHVRRPSLARRHPVHVTLRLVDGLWPLRTPDCGALVRARIEAFAKTERFQVRDYSIQGNHIHLIVEAEDREALASGIRSLEIRLAIHLNRLMQRRGRVFADRYHAHILTTPTEVKHALRYVLQNRRKHAAEQGRELPESWKYPYSSACYPLAAPRTWSLRRARAELAPG